MDGRKRPMNTGWFLIAVTRTHTQAHAYENIAHVELLLHGAPVEHMHFSDGSAVVCRF